MEQRCLSALAKHADEEHLGVLADVHFAEARELIQRISNTFSAPNTT
jgi:hypothetical protein